MRENKTLVQARIPDSDLDQLKTLARSEGLSVSATLRRMIKRQVGIPRGSRLVSEVEVAIGFTASVKTHLTCDLCRARLLEVDGLTSPNDSRLSDRMAAHRGSCVGRRIEAYVAEIFPSVEDVTGVSVADGEKKYPLWSFNLGRRLPRDASETVEEAQATIANQVLVYFQEAFGPGKRYEKFYWRERPNFIAWMDEEMREQRIALWFNFGIEGWTDDKTLAEFLGVKTATLFGIQQAGEFGGTNYQTI